MGSHLGDPIRPSLNPVTAILVARDVLGNAQAVPILSPSLRKPDLAFLPKRAYWGVELSAEQKFSGPQLRKFLRTQQILLSIGALICLTPWALHIASPFVLVPVNAVVVGNVLSAVDYACPLNNRLTPPWNRVVYVPAYSHYGKYSAIRTPGSIPPQHDITPLLLTRCSNVRTGRRYNPQNGSPHHRGH